MNRPVFTAIEYPESDGKPMGETDLHRDAMVRHIEILKRYFAGQQAYVSGDLLVYYVQGNPKKFVVPDVFVVKGLKQKRKRTFKLWNEMIAPQVVIETTSKKTKKRDLKEKPLIYARIGVQEYFLFDPTSDYLDPSLQGNRLVDGLYQSITPEDVGGVVSQELGLRLQIVDEELQFFRVDTGARLLDDAEAYEREAEGRQCEAERRRVAEAEVVRLQELVAQLQRKNLPK